MPRSALSGGSERSSDDFPSYRIVPFSAEDDEYEDEEILAKPPAPVKQQQHFYYGKAPQNLGQNFRAKKSFAPNFPKMQTDLPPGENKLKMIIIFN